MINLNLKENNCITHDTVSQGNNLVGTTASSLSENLYDDHDDGVMTDTCDPSAERFKSEVTKSTSSASTALTN